ncbi:FecR family protein [Pedobacter sp. MC2016-24]|uniref:FecR family protein n=1 Tax=Pedobacter sp. MC2016-24 TaxID=2780090 RepID=UPI00187F9BB7|nr:FecR domain-containing protein [Pedobacter sp. MC2016-24]MBE9601077.1 FecR domain-containing protein [Pedobacter sp. MC2016-24]
MHRTLAFFVRVLNNMGSNKRDQEQQLLEIIARSKRNEASAQDLQKLDQWYNSFEEAPLYTDGMSADEEEKAMKMLLNRIHHVIDPEVKPVIGYQSWFTYKWVAVAALILLISGMALRFYLDAAQPDLDQSISTVNNILPGTNAATLTLADGRKIKLSESANGNLAKEAGVVIVKTTDGKLVYEVQNAAAETDQINTIATTIGETYQVRFSDGTAVWLNAASSLKFPAKFSKRSSRVVELNGEAYFEVSKDKAHPFIVKSKDQEVTVLGTHFNINSYADENNTKTTLLEGSVRVTNRAIMQGGDPGLRRDERKGNAEVLLKPGQQSLLDHTSIKVAEVQTDDVISWKNGNFMFNNEPMDVVMRKLSRWYPIDVKYSDPSVRNIKFFGTVSRFANVAAVLEMIALTKEVKFEVKGKEITVIRN